MAEYFLDKGADVEQKGHAGYTPLISAAWYGHLNLVKFMVEKGKADMNGKEMHGSTALNIASAREHTSIVEYLRGKGSNVDERDAWGATPFWRAASKGDTAALRQLYKMVTSILVKNHSNS